MFLGVNMLERKKKENQVNRINNKYISYHEKKGWSFGCVALLGGGEGAGVGCSVCG